MAGNPSVQLPPFEWDDPFRRFFQERVPEASVEPTGVTRNFYLDLAEAMTRACVGFQREDGLVVDLLSRADDDVATATARLVGAIAPLVAAGRCPDLVEPAALTMDYATKRLAESSNQRRDLHGPEFYTADLMIGWLWLREHVEERRAATWAEHLGSFDPEEVYWTSGRMMRAEEMNNFVVFGMVGEFLKSRFGLADTLDFIERYLPHQLDLFDDNGMYRDPHSPILYHLTVSQRLSWMLHWGYDGALSERTSELLRRGALMSLFSMSPTGQMPYGGRSNQYQHNEAIAACLFEFEARRHAREGNPAVAGAFKRAARQAAMATVPWVLDADPSRGIKNHFPIDTAHGLDSPDYYAVYSLLAANHFGLAYHLADETIEEGPTPADLGGYVLELSPDFHRAFASAGGYGMQIDLAAEQTHDATGLGRIHREGVPTWVGLSTSIPGTPKFIVQGANEQTAACIGPAWQMADGSWRALADNSEDDRDYEVEVLQETPDGAALQVTYRVPDGGPTVVEEYTVSGEGVRISSRIENAGAERYRFIVPLLADDGEHRPDPQATPGMLTATLAPYQFRAACIDPRDAETKLLEITTANRNGIYRLGAFESTQPEFTVLLAFETRKL